MLSHIICDIKPIIVYSQPLYQAYHDKRNDITLIFTNEFLTLIYNDGLNKLQEKR